MREKQIRRRTVFRREENRGEGTMEKEERKGGRGGSVKGGEEGRKGGRGSSVKGGEEEGRRMKCDVR